MQMIVMIGFMISLAAGAVILDDYPRLSSWSITLIVICYFVVMYAIKRLDTLLTLRQYNSKNIAKIKIGAYVRAVAMLAKLWLILGSAVVSILGFGAIIFTDLNMGRFPLIGNFLTLLPFVIALMIFWVLDYPCHLATRRQQAGSDIMSGILPRQPWTFRQYMLFNIRTHLLFLAVPIGIIIGLGDCINLYLKPALSSFSWGAHVVTAATFLAGPVVFILSPLLIVRIWQTKPMPQCPLKDDLDAMSKKFNLKFRQLRIWCSDGIIANAAVLGFTSRIRYILLSDGLLDGMSREQVRSVFAHEAGHIMYHHILSMIIFLISTMLLVSSGAFLLARIAEIPNWLQLMVTTGVTICAFGVFFGRMSRQFERQADVLAAWESGPPAGDDEDPGRISIEGAEIFATALEKVAALNHISIHKWNWRHGSIAWRVRYIRSLAYQGLTRCEINHQVKRVKLLLWLALAVGIATTVFMEHILALANLRCDGF